MPTPLTDADKVLRNDTGIDIATNIASIASALTPSNITDLGDVNLTNPITDGQVIKYDTATQKWVNGLGNITMECTQAQYDAWKQSGQLKTNTLYVITDAPNLNATAQDISYDGGADTVWDKVEEKQDKSTLRTDNFLVQNFQSSEITVPANGALNVTANTMNYQIPSGYVPIAIAGWYTGSNDTFARSIEITAQGTQSFCVLRNTGSSAFTGSYQVKILFIKA